ncbi:MraY family glycosyltransferase [Candidatus Thiosymbion oneisti]|uniref:MraY family glycosyltransferase n=1 Tax=Candidatus Thiosymbion oneisti TaxID=589554 RepID=UPI000A4E049B|nr:glycosyltransferase family 4 protein [Candidatus Thiosymbion oneisti]
MSQAVVASISLVVAFTISALLTWWFSRSPALFSRMVDLPNERSLHAGVLPRTGGIAVCTALAVAYVLALAAFPLPSPWAWIGGALLLVGGISLLDDYGGVRARYRLTAHLGAGILLLVGGIAWSGIELPGIYRELSNTLSWFLTLGYLVWMVNLYNFMDGMDGFAGGMAVFGFGALGVLGWQGEDPGFALANGVVVAAAAGFLFYNFPPARIFLGDLGSAVLGLLAATLSLVGTRRGLFPLWVAWLAFSPFIVDASWTLLRRLVRGEHVWKAHRSHHYQRLVLTGWSHRRTVLWSYLLMAACAATAVAARDLGVRDQWLLLGAWAIVYLVIGTKTRLVERSADTPAP